jgi:hypothetical protein
MRTEDNLMLCTISEFAEFLAKGYNDSKPLDSYFTECDFCIVDEADDEYADLDDNDDDLFAIASGGCSWYGVKVVPDVGFDIEDMTLWTDYYGGGCAEVCTFFPGVASYESVSDRIARMIISSLSQQEYGVYEKTLLLVQTVRTVRGDGSVVEDTESKEETPCSDNGAVETVLQMYTELSASQQQKVTDYIKSLRGE